MPTFPGQAPRSLGLMLAVAAVLFLLGGLVQINPIWLWGPYDVCAGHQRRAARLVPRLADRRAAAGARASTSTIGDYTLVPNPFWGGALFPLVVLAVLLALAVARAPGHRRPQLPQRARPPARRAAADRVRRWLPDLGRRSSSSPAPADRVLVFLGLSYVGQIWFYRSPRRAPFVAYFVTKRVCFALQESERVESEREAATVGTVRRTGGPSAPAG